MSERWEAQVERGSPQMMRVAIWIARHLGRSFTRLLLYPIVVYFLLTGTEARRASTNFLQRALDRPPNLLDNVRHFYTAAAVELDRVYLLGAQIDSIEVTLQRAETVDEVVEQARGCLILVAHFGSFEVMRVAGVMNKNLPIRILVDRQHGLMMTQILEALNPELAAATIDASQRGPQLVLELQQALDQGQVLGMMADRVYGDERSVPVEFLGGTVRLPTSPWILASVLQVPVFLSFGIYRGGNRYDAYFEPLAERISLPRQNREAALRSWAQKYASRLEHHARLAPYNWFNFYDFWAHETPAN